MPISEAYQNAGNHDGHACQYHSPAGLFDPFRPLGFGHVPGAQKGMNALFCLLFNH